MTLGIARNTADDVGRQAQPARRRENNFDALRLVAAVCVVVQHATAHLGAGFLWYHPGSNLWFFDGVMAFFILSGAMVYTSADRCIRDRRPLRDYFLNRALRIIPAIYAYVTVMTVVLLMLGVVSFSTATSTPFLGWVVSGLALVPVYHPAALHGFGIGVVNGSLWTIPVEVSFYVILPALVWLAHRIGFRAMIAAAFGMGLASTALLAAAGGEDTGSTAGKLFGVTFLPWLVFFVIGIAMARAWDRLPQHGAIAVGCCAAYVAFGALREMAGPAWSLVVAVGAAIPLAYVIFWVGHRGPRLLRKITTRIGDLSFGVYIWHMPLINVAIWAGIRQGPLHDTALVTAALVATLVAAALSWHFMERPALRLKRYSSRPRTQVEGEPAR